MPKKKPDLAPLFLTDEKKAEIYAELKEIETIILPEVRKRLATAYEDGDIPENNPFITANDDLQEAMKRRNDLRRLLLRAKIYNQEHHTRRTDGIHLGDTAVVVLGSDTLSVILVNSEEADPAENKISVDSPLGKALLGKLPGETVEFHTPSGSQTVSILV